MAGSQTLYRKYRSLKLDEIIGQKHITDLLLKSVDDNKLSHAYLFSGPHGVGKTSVARILAYLINNLDYSLDSSHVDIIEIDAASNRKIDEIRDLREKVHLAPLQAKFKVYIIDEVHMLTNEAFNALLKTLEEPPEHVIFILATTEIHKLPETIVSRVQRHNFRLVGEESIIEHLRKIAESEGIDISDEALKLIASHGSGSVRDSLSSLGQFTSHNEVSEETVTNQLGIAGSDELMGLYASVLESDIEKINSVIDQMTAKGVSAKQIATQLSSKIIEDAIAKGSNLKINLALKLLEIPSSNQEIVLKAVIIDSLGSVANKVDPPPSSPVEETSKNKQQEPPKRKVSKKPIAKKVNHQSGKNWKDLLEHAKDKNAKIYSALKMSDYKIDKENKELTISTSYDIYFEKLNSVDLKADLKKLVNEFFEIDDIIIDKLENKEIIEKTDPVGSVISIMGGGEVMKTIEL